MTENKSSYQDNIPESSAAPLSSIQQQSPSPGKSAARGDAAGTPVLFVESLRLEDLLDRAALDVESEFWPSAVAYADRALAVDPSCARAYLYKLLAELKAKDIEQLKKQKRPFDDNPNCRKAMQLGDERLRSQLLEANGYICDHLNELYQGELDQVRHALAYANVVSDLAVAENLLEHMPRFPAADQLRENCAAKKQDLFAVTFQRAENCASEMKWTEAVSLLESISYDEKSRVRLLEYRKKLETEEKYQQGVEFQEKYLFREAAQVFGELGDYRDSRQRYKRCSRMIRGNKVRAVGRKHTKAVWANVFLSVLMALSTAACLPVAPNFWGFLLRALLAVPLGALSIVLTIIRARYRPAKRMWIVMAAVFTAFVLLTAFGVLTFSPAGSMIPSLISLALMFCAIFI